MSNFESGMLRFARGFAVSAALVAIFGGCGGGGGGEAPAPVPVPSTFSIGGTVSGIAAGSSVSISSGSRSTTLSADGAFTLGRDFASGASYSVLAIPSAPQKRCVVRNGQGAVSTAAVSDILVDCSLGTAWVTNGQVLASALSADGRTLYVGGTFDRVGPPSGSFVRTDVTTGGLLDVPTPIVANVIAASGDGEGGAYLTLQNRQPRSFETSASAYSMLRVDANGRTTSFAAPGLGALPGTFLRVGGVLFVGGSFLLSGSASPQGVAAIDATTGALQPWRAAGVVGVQALATAGNLLFAVRTVQSTSGVHRTTLAAIDIGTGAVRSWAPDFGFSTSMSGPLQIAVSGSSLIVAGAFEQVDGMARQGIAAFDTVTLALRSWNPAASNGLAAAGISGFAVSSDTVYVIGSFTRIGGADRSAMAALSTDTGLALGWQPAAIDNPGLVTSMVVHEGNLVLAGNFTTVGGLPRSGLAALSAATGTLQTYGADSEIPYPVLLLSSGQRLWAGGNFPLAGGVKRRCIAAIDTHTGQAAGWTLDLGRCGWVSHLMVLGSKLVIAGSFDSVAGVSRRALAALDTATGQALAWDGQFDNSTQVLQLLAQGETLYVVGNFSSWAGQTRSGVARFDARTLGLQDWAIQGSPGFVATALAASAERVYVAGGPTGAAAFDPTSGARLAWDAQLSGQPGSVPSIREIVLAGGSVYMVGQNIVVGDSSTRRLVKTVRSDAVTGATLALPSTAENMSRLFMVDGRLLGSRCTGSVTEMTSCTLAELSADTGADRLLLTTLDATINTVSSDALSTYVGGGFGTNGIVPQSLLFLSR